MNNDIRGLINSVNDGSTSAFMWEWFTTKPFVDAGEARFVSGCQSILSAMQSQPVVRKIGSVPTPWPSWLIAAHPSRVPLKDVGTFLKELTRHVRDFDSEANRVRADIKFIQKNFGYAVEDIEVMNRLNHWRPLELTRCSRHGLGQLHIQKIARRYLRM